MNTEKKNILFIVNPKAGITIKSKLLIRLLAGKYLDNDRYIPEIQFTKYPKHATTLAAEAYNRGTRIIVAVGGDGTVNEVATALSGTDACMGILPTGSGNGLAHHLSIPMNLIRALQVINRGKTKRVDTVDLNGRLFTSIAGIGFDAIVAKKFASSGVRGLLSYMRIILQEYKDYEPRDYLMMIDGKTIARTALMITFANGDQFGFHTRIAPHAKVDDGWLDICVIRKPSFIKVFFTAPSVFWGSFGKTGYAEYFRGKDIQIDGTAGSLVNLDGEAMELEKDLHIGIRPGTLNVIVK